MTNEYLLIDLKKMALPHMPHFEHLNYILKYNQKVLLKEKCIHKTIISGK